MNNNNSGVFDSMKKIFPVSKTISFRLVPIGKTEEKMKERKASNDGTLSSILERATQLKADYQILKKAADRFHKKFIEDTLSALHLRYVSEGNNDSIQEYANIYFNTELQQKDKENIIANIAAALKEEIGAAFARVKYNAEKTMLQALSSELLVKEIIGTLELSNEEKDALERLKPYTSYMRPYFTIRDRMYRADQKGHTIPNRIIEDNLPVHLNNVKHFAEMPKAILDTIEPLFQSLAVSMQAYAIEDVFSPSYFSLLCPQSAIDRYNTLISGYSLDDGTKVKGLNELVNEYNQTKPAKKLPHFKKLYKQILTDREGLSWIPDVMTSDEEVIRAAEGLHTLLDNFAGAAGYHAEPRTIFVNAKRLSNYSHKVFGKWNTAELAIMEKIQAENPKKNREKENGYNTRLQKIFKGYTAFSVEEIHQAVNMSLGLKDTEAYNAEQCLVDYYQKEILNPVDDAKADYAEFRKRLDANGSLKDGTDAASKLKDFLDNLTIAKNAAGIFTDLDGTLDTDTLFYEEVVDFFKEFAEAFVPVYNIIRNYLTKKPYSTEKVQLYFDNPSLLAGWDIDKEKTYRSVLLRKGDDIFLAIMPKGLGGLLQLDEAFDEQSELKKLTMKVMQKPYMMLPKVAFNKEVREAASCPPGFPTEPWELYLKSGKDVKDYTSEEIALMIDFYKNIIANKKEWEIYHFSFKETSEYKRLNDFYDDVARQAYYVSYTGISEEFVNKAVEAGNMFLFQLTCQDMQKTHHGKDNNYKVLLYEALNNRPGSDIRLNGGAAVYYRPASLPRKVTHPAGVPMPNKNPDTPNETRTLHYDLIKDRRYTEDQYQIHLAVTIYPNSDKNGAGTVNKRVQDIIRANPGMYVLGINRGERNLISIAVTAPDGRIVEQRNLNVFDNFNYQRKLAEREKERNDDRRNWTSVKEIKNLKAGYLSRVVGEIVTLVKKYNCIVAMERLDMDFKNGRQAFEKNVYEQFEKNVVNKLSFLMDKNDPDRMDGVLQLTNPGKTEQDRTRYPQSGIVFLVNPSYISRTDPLTGFTCRLPFRYESIEKAEELMSKMDAFRYDEKKGRFVLSFHYGKAAPQKEGGDPGRVWDVETNGVRIEQVKDTSENPKGIWRDDVIDLTAKMKELFAGAGVDYKDGKDLLCRLGGKNAEFWKELMHLLRLTVKPANWDSATREYRIVGCVANKNGVFFDSRTAPASFPKDGDVLAAWNIARKTHVILKGIRDYNPGDVKGPDGKKPKGPSTIISDAEWFDTL